LYDKFPGDKSGDCEPGEEFKDGMIPVKRQT